MSIRQEVTIFFHNTTDSRGIGIDEQINNYIKENPSKRISSISYAVGSVFEKAIVVFDIKEETNNDKEKFNYQPRQDKRINKNNGS